MPLRTWFLWTGSVCGVCTLASGVQALYPAYRLITYGVAVLSITFIYGRLTGLPWLPQIVRIVGDLMRRDR